MSHRIARQAGSGNRFEPPEITVAHKGERLNNTALPAFGHADA
jgi:hypothetical protein